VGNFPASKTYQFLGKYVDMQDMKRIITTHLFDMLYYASTVWLNEQTTPFITKD